MTVFGKTNQLARISISSSTKTLMEFKKKKLVLLEGEASYWFQIWTIASSLNLKGYNDFFFSLTGWFSQIRSHIHFMKKDAKLQSKKRLHVQQFCYNFFNNIQHSYVLL